MKQGNKMNTNVSIGLLILSIACLSLGQPICQAPQNTLYSNTDLNVFSNCQQINGSLVMGDQFCTRSCTITDFSALSNLQAITGSFIVQCCHTLSVFPNIPRLTQIQGALRIYYNTGLRSIAGLILGTVGSLEIAQNQLLHSIDVLQINRISNYVSISYNPSLGSIRGLTNLISIEGNQLVNGHALRILYNPILTDISGFQSLDTINHGTVHIEGNTQLCYSGYPRWSYGSYESRYSTGDKGIDWRSKLNTQYSWQFTWGGNGVPTLNIQGNGNYSTCASTTCHSSCQSGVGCLGPSNPGLCGSCYQTSTINSCDEVSAPETVTQNCVTLWPPTELPFSAIFGLLVACGGTLIIIVLIALCIVVYKIRKKCNGDEESKGNYNVNERNLESGSSYQPSRNTYSSGSRSKLHHSNNEMEMRETSPQVSSYNPADDDYTYSQVVKKTPTAQETRKQEEPIVHKPTYEERQEEKEESEEEEEESEEEPRDNFMEEYEMPSRKIQLMKEIGEGSFGKVFKGLASDVLPNERVTDVIVKQSHRNATEDELEDFLEPAEKMRNLKHDNVLHLLGVCVDSDNMLIVLEDCANGNLKTFLINKRSRMEIMKKDGSLLQMIIEMAEGLNYLHDNSITHSDFAARNCLVCANNRIKVGDYGLSRQLFRGDYYSRTPGQTAWPIRWMAPEVFIEVKGMIKSTKETTASNIWSFGITLWEVSTFAEQPYPDMTDEEVIEQVARREYCNLRNPVPTFDPLCALFAIMMKCWKRERERPNMASVLNLLKNVTLNTRGMEAKESIRLKAAAKTKKKSGRSQRESSQEPLLATSLTIESDGGDSEEGRSRKPAREEKKGKEEKRDERRGEENRKSKETKITVEAEVREEVVQAEEKSKKSGKRDSKGGKEKSKKGSKKKETESKKKVTGDPVPTSVPVVPHKDEHSDISDMDDIFYPSGPPPGPAAAHASPPSDDEESWDERVIPPPHPPSQLPSQPQSQRESYRYSRESWDSFDDDYDEDEQTDGVRSAPLPPTQFSQEEEEEEEEPPLPPQDLPPDLTPNEQIDWEESEPVATPPGVYPTDEVINRTNPYATELQDEEEVSLPPPLPAEEDDIGTDEESLQPIEPVKLDRFARVDSRGFDDSDEINTPMTETGGGRGAEEDSDDINVPVQSEEKSTGKKTKASKKEEKEREKAKKKELKEKKKKEKQQRSIKKKKSKGGEDDKEKGGDEPALVW